MATADQIITLRRMISEFNSAEPYSDATLTLRINQASSLDQLAYDIWTEKAAGLALLVDISEGGSSRKMGDAYEQALGMATFYGRRVPGLLPGSGRTRISKLTRS